MSLANAPILLVSIGVAYGGAETYYVKLARILQTRHTLVAVVCCPRLFTEFQALGIDVAYAGENLFGAKRYLASMRACFQMVRRYHPRLAHLNGQPESYLAPFLRLLGLEVLTTRHTPFSDLFMMEGSGVPVFLKRWIVLFCLGCARRTICVSQLLYRQLAEHLSPSRLTFIPTWVEDSFLIPYIRPNPSIPLRALFVGRIVRNKGIFDVIEAMRLCPNVHLTVVGEGDQMVEAQQKAAGLPITFAGFSRDCSSAYRSADLLLFASPEGFEGLPQVPLEALAMGLPCLASNISSILEIGDTDRPDSPVLAFYQQGDARDLAIQLRALASDSARLAKLSAAGRRQVERRFTVAAVAPAYLAQFAEVQS